jgi:glyoxylase-like metal-dependent hydrolase (beta-lactamase superfamily II)
MSNSNINIKVLPALNGESILVEISGKVFLIDGGYVNTYDEYLYPELRTLSKKGYEISHLIASHIDADHISGLIKFLDANIENQIIPINNIWHNSFRHIQHLEEKKSLISVKGFRNDIDTIPNKSYLRKIVKECKILVLSKDHH